MKTRSRSQTSRIFRAGRNIEPTHGGRAAVPIRERKVTTFRAIEYIVFVEGSLLECELFHNGREAEYPEALEARIKQFADGGWQPVRVPDDPAV